MSEINQLFNIENYNIIQDENYYYLFRALNNGDHNDLENGIIRNANGQITKIRTDRARYVENYVERTPKYKEDEPISLLQVIDHIKEHHRYEAGLSHVLGEHPLMLYLFFDFVLSNHIYSIEGQTPQYFAAFFRNSLNDW